MRPKSSLSHANMIPTKNNPTVASVSLMAQSRYPYKVHRIENSVFAGAETMIGFT